MTIAALRKFEPAADGFFDLDSSYGAGGAAQARARAARAAARGERTADNLRTVIEAPGVGVYALSRADAADMNRVVDLPEQPNYDWSDVRDMSDDEE